MADKTNNKNFKKSFNRWFWGIFIAGLLSVAGIFFFINIGWLGYLPAIDQLQNPINKYATELYSADLKLIGSFSESDDNRIKTEYNQISKHVIDALISTEDERFYDHSGIDGKALARVFVKRGLFRQKSSGGGSTITQQLSKLLYSPKANNIFQRALQKPIEWVIAVQLEKIYTKEEIITLYLNQFDFLYNAVGIKSAAHVYFNVTPAELNIEEAATLIGMCKNPSLYNPRRFPDRALQRRNVVLDQMRKSGHLSLAERDSISQLPLEIDFQRIDHRQGLAPYFRQYLRVIMTAKKPVKSNYASWQDEIFKEDLWQWENNPLYGFCNKNFKPDGSPYNLYTDGLKIYTTIDSRMQQYAEEAVNEHMPQLQRTFFQEKKGRSYAPFSKHVTQEEINASLNRSMRDSERYRRLKKSGASTEEINRIFDTKTEMQVFSYNGMIDTIMSPRDSVRYIKHFLRCGFVSIDSKTGHVKAYVGGPDFAHFQYDMVTLGKRQVGSTIKPFLYTLAMDEGMWPCDKTMNVPITLKDGNGEDWSPTNTSSARVGEEVTLKWGLANSNNWISAYLMSLFTPESLVKLMQSFGIRSHLDPVISLCLGPADISLIEMVDAYTAFQNKGIRVDPLYVTRIEDSHGNVIGTFTPNMYEIFSESTAYKMIYMLRAVIDEGTGVRVRYRYKLNMPMGGKTGTTQNNSDGWFMGFTPSLASGVWVGGEDRAIHFDNIAEGQGANMALPIWALYMQKVLADSTLGYTPDEQFDIPASFNANAGCEENVFDW
ncbi:MAG TPA: transglycosylase domain-containing protein [Paludibacter sp.]|nr:transglycosylase domain-containing protein [Paludibacter sp.]HOS45098.1 transglycosylase domain-containing protein [Paludibacter sp.]